MCVEAQGDCQGNGFAFQAAPELLLEGLPLSAGLEQQQLCPGAAVSRVGCPCSAEPLTAGLGLLGGSGEASPSRKLLQEEAAGQAELLGWVPQTSPSAQMD